MKLQTRSLYVCRNEERSRRGSFRGEWYTQRRVGTEVYTVNARGVSRDRQQPSKTRKKFPSPSTVGSHRQYV